MRSDFHTSTLASPKLDYKAVFEATLSPYLLLALDFTIIGVNDAYLAVTKRNRESLLGQNILDVSPGVNDPDHQQFRRDLQLSLQRVLRESAADFMPIQRINRFTEVMQPLFLSAVNKPVFDADGVLLYIIHRVEEVTEFQADDERHLRLAKAHLERLVSKRTHELALNEHKFRLMANTMPQIVWTARQDGTVDWLNDCWYQFTGTARGSEWDAGLQTVHPDDRKALKEEWKLAVAAGRAFEKDFRFKRHTDGEYCWHLSRAVPQRDDRGEIVFWIGTSTDIHERKKLVAELEQARFEAEEANRLKSAFLMNMTHELRTPLTAITGFSQLLHEQNFSRDLEKRYLAVIDRNGCQLLRIIDDILDLSKVESGKLTIERQRLTLPDILADIKAFLELKTQETGLACSVEIAGLVPETIETDPARLKQILVNLINNAVKFTSRGRVDIRVFHDQVHEKLCFEIKDTGRGVGADKAAGLFEPFVQADSSITRIHGGTGLGLTLSRHLARALGGDVVLQSSQLTRGSSFIASVHPGCLEGIRMIDSRASRKAELRQQQIALLEKFTGSLKGRKILLVDDADDNRALISAILHRTHATLVTARDGVECLDYAAAEDFDLTLMDMQMPRMDGFEATRILRQKGYSKPIVALTAHAMREQIKRCHDAGCTAHLAKPVNQGELIETVVKLMG